MKLDIQIRAIPEESDGISVKHDRFLEAVRGLGSPWGAERTPSVPSLGTAYGTGVSASKIFGKGVRGDIHYRRREGLRDSASSDDFLFLTADTRRTDLRYLIDVAFLAYVQAFGAYSGSILDDRFSVFDYEARSLVRSDQRHSMFRVPMVGYLTPEFSERAFALSAEVLVKRLSTLCARSELTAGGAFFVLTYDILEFDEFTRLSDEAKRLLLSR